MIDVKIILRTHDNLASTIESLLNSGYVYNHSMPSYSTPDKNYLPFCVYTRGSLDESPQDIQVSELQESLNQLQAKYDSQQENYMVNQEAASKRVKEADNLAREQKNLIETLKAQVIDLQSKLSGRDNQLSEVNSKLKIQNDRADHLEASLEEVTNDNHMLRSQVKLLEEKQSKKSWWK